MDTQTFKHDPDAGEAFRRAGLGHGNFMTPDMIATAFVHGKGGAYFAVELSRGSGLEQGTTIYGVTVIGADAPYKRHLDLDKCLHSEAEAYAYIDSLSEAE